MGDSNKYTVGWICAITTEYVAAKAFLDREHESLDYGSANDNNVYTLGEMGKHNVVIAQLPKGEYGIAAAASVARDLVRTFPNIRIGLMVGIGGGAPSKKHDIRLGDIVVSAPHNGKGGLFQYNFGKTIQDQEFRTTGFLDQPPGLLRAAMGDIEAEYEMEGHQLDETINTVLGKRLRLRKKYKRPDLDSDQLYQSHIIHLYNDERSCEVVCGNDESKLVVRRDRSDADDNPAIHYGLIASANQVMKNAVICDRLAAEKDVLCFEIEAAGLMNHFPCLVIQGICDYSDSHKNEDWQGYAAMAAAAYAKDLLSRIPPNKVEAEKRISDVLSLG
jgi:nucleoside phosphorylase